MTKTSVEVDIEDSRLKDIAQCLSNPTCKRILKFLSENEATVSDISEKLNLKINKVDYNVKKLIKAGLIEKKDFFWSIRGKKMPTYIVSDKKIIIRPKSQVNLLIAGACSFILGLFGVGIKTLNNTFNLRKEFFEKNLNPEIYSLGFEKTASDLALENNLAEDFSIQILKNVSNTNYFAGVMQWFLIGASLGILGYLIFYFFIESKGGKIKWKNQLKSLL